METINKTIWVLIDRNGDFFTGSEFSPNFTEALLYDDPLEANHDCETYDFAGCTVQAVLCSGQEMNK